MTVASAFEAIARETKDSKLEQEALDTIAREVKFLKRKMGLTLMQSYIVSVVLENVGETVNCQELAEHADISRLRIMDVHKQIEDLTERGFLNMTLSPDASSEWKARYSATPSLINAVHYNRDLVPEDYSETTVEGMWKILASLLYDCDYSNINYTYMLGKIRGLLAACSHLDFCRKVNEYNLADENLVLLLIVCNCLLNKAEDYANKHDYEDIIPASCYSKIIRQFKTNSNELITNDLVKARNSDADEFRLTPNGILQLLGEEYLGEEKEETRPSSPEIKAKELFYNAEEASQVERLTNLFSQDKFAQIQARMRDAGMRPGFCVIFHGAPGTGKTETVLQLARKTGREIVQVDLSNIKDKYVGESEKRIQAVFTSYSSKLAQKDVAPILLFNEADAVFGKRCTAVESEVDQMANAMQNIILQAMENFEGIMIATTNLADNLDAAFERRFLYKINFKKPSAEVRKKIWMSMIPELGETNAERLASRFDFSGGQIENIARRMMVDSILYGRTLAVKEILTICEEETLAKKRSISIATKMQSPLSPEHLRERRKPST